jgi:glycosyltransferase involved in cell wall biosynthesis
MNALTDIRKPPEWPKEKRAVAFFSSMLMGGAERQMATLAAGLSEAGYHCSIFCQGPKYRSGPIVEVMSDTDVHVVHSEDLPDLCYYDSVITWGTDVFQGISNLPPMVYIVHSDGEDTERMLEHYKHTFSNPVGVSGPAAALCQRVSGHKTEVIWNGSEPITAHGRLPAGPEADSFIMGFLGRYSPEKNVTAAVEALKHLPEFVRLRLYGYGSEADTYRKLANKLNIEDRLDVCGVVTDLSRAYSELDCLVLPSLYEGFPMTVCEAMLAGVPVVACPHGDLPLLFHELGLGVPIRPTPESVASGVMQVIDWPQQTLKMRGRALEFARTHLTQEAMCRRYADKIERILWQQVAE